MSDDPGDDDGPSFEERLKAARRRQGLDTPPRSPGLDPGGLGQSGLHDMLELELLNRAEVSVGSWSSLGARPARLAATLV